MAKGSAVCPGSGMPCMDQGGPDSCHKRRECRVMLKLGWVYEEASQEVQRALLEVISEDCDAVEVAHRFWSAEWWPGVLVFRWRPALVPQGGQ